MGFWNKSPTLPLNQGLYEKSLYETKGFMKKEKKNTSVAIPWTLLAGLVLQISVKNVNCCWFNVTNSVNAVMTTGNSFFIHLFIHTFFETF